jgi:hypothetical protein
MTSNDQSSLWLDTGPSERWALWPRVNAALSTHASKACCDSQRV